MPVLACKIYGNLLASSSTVKEYHSFHLYHYEMRALFIIISSASVLVKLNWGKHTSVVLKCWTISFDH